MPNQRANETGDFKFCHSLNSSISSYAGADQPSMSFTHSPAPSAASTPPLASVSSFSTDQEATYDENPWWYSYCGYSNDSNPPSYSNYHGNVNSTQALASESNSFQPVSGFNFSSYHATSSI